MRNNIFVPNNDFDNAEYLVAEYHKHLMPLAEKLHIDISDTPVYTDDYFWEKIELLTQSPISLISFTFGLPPAQIIDTLKAQDKILCATVT